MVNVRKLYFQYKYWFLKKILLGMDLKIMQEVRHVIDDLNDRIDRRNSNSEEGILESVDEFFDLPDLNVIWELVAGIRSGGGG